MAPAPSDTRRAAVELMLQSRDVIAAGLRSPALFGAVLLRLPTEHRCVLTGFMADLAAALQLADRLALKRRLSGMTSPPGVSPRRQAGAGPTSPLAPAGAPAVSLFADAVLGVNPSPPIVPPNATEVSEPYLSGPSAHGLVQGDAGLLLQLLQRHPTVDTFLQRRLVMDVAAAVAAAADAGGDVDAEVAAATNEPSPSSRSSDSRLSPLPGGMNDEDLMDTFGGYTVAVADALALANMAWVQRHPTDLEFVSRHGSVRRHRGADVEAQTTRLLRCNLALHYPEARWAPLLAVRDVVAAELNGLCQGLQQLGGDGDGALMHVTQCVDDLKLISIHADPEELRQALLGKLTRGLHGLTALACDYGIEESVHMAPGEALAPVVPKKASWRDRFTSSKSAAEAPLQVVTKAVQQAADVLKRNLRVAMSFSADAPAEEAA
jgi:hypothetical protein